MLAITFFLAILAMGAGSNGLDGVPTPPEAIAANENRTAAGVSDGRLVNVALEARWGRWYPDGPGQPWVPMQAFGERGKPLQIPAPLLRVNVGTEIVLKIRNAVPGTTLIVHGLVNRPARTDAPVSVPFGETRAVRFRAGVSGTYDYWATTTGHNAALRFGWDSQLTGAIVVDPAGTAPAAPKDDRIFVVGNWIRFADPAGLPIRRYELLAINGRAWPHTERLTYDRGANVRWHWINVSAGPHPMHLHGAYFRVDSRGNGLADVPQPVRNLEVTDFLPVGGTSTMTWRAERPGNWLMHCHVPFHQIAHMPVSAMLAAGETVDAETYQNVHAAHADMGGLVLGLTVRGAPGWRAPMQRAGRKLVLLVTPAQGNGPATPAFAYILQDGGHQFSEAGAIGPRITLSQGDPVTIDIHNALTETTTVHWHGIEMTDSYYDGVDGFSGYGERLAPMIMPGKSFEARFTPPRAGTFIYHTHMHDPWQIRGGLTGPLIVLPPGVHFDSSTDHIVMLTPPQSVKEALTFVNINGFRSPAPLKIRAGVRQRFRFINMTASQGQAVVSLESGSTTVLWRPVAIDGAELPLTQQHPERAVRLLTIGKTLDFELTPTTPGVLTLQVNAADTHRFLGSLAIEVK